MIVNSFRPAKTSFLLLVGLVFIQLCAFAAAAQKKLAPARTGPQAPAVKVTQIDENGIKAALKQNGKPLLVNFWATWCDPCREEFPDLVKIDADYRGRVDLITISLDEPEDIATIVPKFLGEMKAEMPAYLLEAADESAVIASISPDWQGALPFTVLYNEKGEIAYLKQGKFKPDVLRAAIEKVLGARSPNASTADPATVPSSGDLELARRVPSTAEGLADARRDIAGGQLRIRKYGLAPAATQAWTREAKARYGVEIVDHGCLVPESPEYFMAYNETMRREIERRFNAAVARLFPL